ncbi:MULTISPECIES: metallophosphoesterase family protein [Bacillus]|uniref:metallophosphoesterase family protein n=1 Tax=Bacillus TaxID=1386 RepID=UPI000BB90EC2|nr:MULTISPECIES: DNA repair exonuclease [Bacillus]
MEKIRFIHAADLHLDSPFIGLHTLPQPILQRIRHSTFQAFQTIIDNAIKYNIDFLLIAGDLFDGENRSLFAQAKLREGFQRLEEQDIPVYIIHGNHDPVLKDTKTFRYPNNVHIFSTTVETKPFYKNGTQIANIYGFSYPTKHVTSNMTSFYNKENNDVPYHIGMLHGNLDGNTDHDPYAPFTMNELLEKDFHYWALGHIHKRQILHERPSIVYPGNIQGRHKKERGEKGIYLVELQQESETLSFIQTSNVLWDTITFNITTLASMDEIINNLKKLIEELRCKEKGLLIQLELVGQNQLHHELQNAQVLEDLLFLLNEKEESTFDFVYVYDILLKTSNVINKKELEEVPFYRDFFHVVERTDDVQVALSSLYHHNEARKVLQKLTEKELEEVKREAEQLLLEELLHDRR